MDSRKAAFLILFCCAHVVRGAAQANELAVSFGAMHSSGQTATILAPIPCPGINSDCDQISTSTGTNATLEFMFARRLFTFGASSLDVEFPLTAAPDRDVTISVRGVTMPGLFSTTSLFFTPSARVRFFHLSPVSLFTSIGGGLARLNLQAVTPPFVSLTEHSTNNGALQFGGGVDFATPMPHLVFRLEVRDFWATGIARASSVVRVSPEHQHNIFAGIGAVWRF